MRAAIFLLFGLALSQDQGARRDAEVQYHTSVLQNIFSDYDANRRPPAEKPNLPSIIVQVSVHVIDVKYDDGYATILMYFRQRWQDSRLSLPTTDQGNTVSQLLRGVLVPKSRQVWTPNSYFVNGFTKSENANLKQTSIQEDGRIFYSQQLVLKVPARQNFATGRIDVDLQIGSYTYDLSDVFYVWERGDAVNGDAVAGFDRHNCTDELDEIIGGYSCIRAEVHLKENCWALLVRYGIPSVTLVIVSLLHFWLPTTWSVARPISAILPVLIFATLMLAGAVSLHSATELIWFTICLGITLASVLEYFTIATCHSCPKKSSEKEMDPLVGASVGRHRSAPLDLSCRVILPLIFLILLILFFILFNLIF